MALNASRFTGLAIGASALRVLRAIYAFGQMGPETGGIAGYGPNDWLALNDNSKVTKDEMPGGIRHIVRRH